MRYVRNTWYPLAWSHDITRTLTRRTVIEQNVVLYRSSDGSVVALDDLCPHRMLPLSLGRLKGDAIECGYHGMTFDGAGKCIRVPGQNVIPRNAVVRSYPTGERLGLVWIWMGDPELADRSKIFDLPEFHDPNWSVVFGDALHNQSNYLNLADNLCDPSHVSFVHSGSLGNAASEDIPVQSERDGEKILVWRWVPDAPPIGIFQNYRKFSGNVDRWHYYHYYAPSIAVIDFGTAPAGSIPVDGDRNRGMRIFAGHFITPVDERTSIDHWLHIRNFNQDDPDVASQLNSDFRAVFDEDRLILEALHREEEARPDFKRINLAIDAAPNKMRRIVDDMIARDQTLASQ
ncbi:phenylpropionate dioxygenase-like ring-hydroxylating dioxygenase large terminal subunit [Bradyrhizobium sp. AZCC 2262]|uniref:aromatic ring-hydroxylating dioxygenase subunit alpha n=1 Tax=Bradyrhizobium sp. AZCC 2262 TaxID=3117022 RepID=UPI002FEF7498